MDNKIIQLNRITTAEHNILFEQREEMGERTSYAAEKVFLNAIRRGDKATLHSVFNYPVSTPAPVGNMSKDDLRQAQYLAVALITLATRVAIEEGVPEAEAFSLSDECVLKIDRQRDVDAVTRGLLLMAEQFSDRISSFRSRYSRQIKSAVDYISTHLHSKPSLEEIAEHCSVSPAYLSRRFHEETGETLHSYIMREKLEEARTLLSAHDRSCAEVASILGFSSQSHFTACFQRQYGITPAKYRNKA